MASTTKDDFGANTEGLEVAKEFAAQIQGKTVLVTGGNLNGIGFTTAQAIASQAPAHIIIAGRSQTRVAECIDKIKTEFPNVDYRPLEVDLSSQRSSRAAAAKVLGWSDVPIIDLIFNSAGVMGIQERTLSEDGTEMHFATNHIGHWLLTCLIMPKLIKAAQNNPKGATRIVNITSLSPTVSTMRWSDFNFDKKNKDLPEAEQPDYEHFNAWGYTDPEDDAYVPLDGYSRSKVANVLFGIAANKRLFDKYGIFTTAAHPGVIVGTDLGRHFPASTIEATKKMFEAGIYSTKTQGAGAATGLVGGLDPKLAVGVGDTKNGSENWGAFLIDCQISDKATGLAVSSKEAEKLWALSEKLVGDKFEW